MLGERESVGVSAVQYVRQGLQRGADKLAPKNPDEFLQRALAEWPLFDQLIARLYVDYQNAMDRADAAASKGLPGLKRVVGFAASHQQLLAWMTRYAKAGQAKRRAQKG